jgi:hypothetical protein
MLQQLPDPQEAAFASRLIMGLTDPCPATRLASKNAFTHEHQAPAQWQAHFLEAVRRLPCDAAEKLEVRRGTAPGPAAARAARAAPGPAARAVWALPGPGAARTRQAAGAEAERPEGALHPPTTRHKPR